MKTRRAPRTRRLSPVVRQSLRDVARHGHLSQFSGQRSRIFCISLRRGPSCGFRVIQRCLKTAARPPHSRLFAAETIALRGQTSVSVASFRAISRIALIAILQTIALPTELPRRGPHFTRKLAGEPNGLRGNGLSNHVVLLRNCPRSRARRALNHCSNSTFQVVETIALTRPCDRPGRSECASSRAWRRSDVPVEMTDRRTLKFETPCRSHRVRRREGACLRSARAVPQAPEVVVADPH
jgi:hypothetical protein